MSLWAQLTNSAYNQFRLTYTIQPLLCKQGSPYNKGSLNWIKTRLLYKMKRNWVPGTRLFYYLYIGGVLGYNGYRWEECR